MTQQGRVLSGVFCLIMVFVMIGACGKTEPKQGRLIISEQEFVLRQDSEHAYVMDAKGKVKNLGDVDVKNVSVTGVCKSCGELINPGNWFYSDIEKTDEQRDVISYIAAGDEERFDFRDVAFIYTKEPARPNPPEELEAVIESFETVD